MKIKFNLLPKKQKNHLNRRKTFRIIMEEEIHVMIAFIFLIVGLFAIYFILKTEISVMEDVKSGVVNDERYKEVAAIHDEFINVNKKVNSIKDLDKNHLRWSRLLDFLSKNVSSAILIESVETINDSVSIKAQADTRENVIELKDALKAVEYDGKKCFTNVIVPEEQLATPVDIFFTMTFKVNLDCLK